MSAQHVEGGICWCDDLDAREHALDVLWPDRCQVRSDMGTPHGQRRTCTELASHPDPCHGHLERRGGPCHFCGKFFSGDSCTDCWTSLEGMNIADLKGVFAGTEFSIDPIVGGSSEGSQQ
jgi:hypothetical protein